MFCSECVTVSSVT